jgi:glutaminyl-peptide cyclotransferase
VKFLIYIILFLSVFSQNPNYTVIKKHKHNKNDFTQGLQIHNGFLYEGTGKNAESYLKKYDLKTMKLLKSIKLDNQYFGEGITIVGHEIYQITWQKCTAFIYDLETMTFQRNVLYQSEGWGLAYDNQNLFMSDGSDKLYLRSADTFEILETIHVQENGKPVKYLNELEMVNGKLFANIYTFNEIAIIDPYSGYLIARIDFSDIVKEEKKKNKKAKEFNGIAYDKISGHFFLTGKYWSTLYEVKLTNY